MIAALVRYAPVALLALAWEASVRLGAVSRDMLPPLSEIAGAWWRLMRDGDIPQHAAASFSRAGAGLLIALCVGGIGGLLMVWSRVVHHVLNPILQMLYPVPKSALIPLVLIFFGIGAASKVFLIALGCTLPILISTYNGARGVERSLIWSARSLGAGEAAVMWQVRVPAALPEILNGLRTALAFCFILLVSSELLISRDGLGYLIASLGEAGVYPEMFAVILTVALCGFFADRLALAVSRAALRWQEGT
ncbi:MAG TPA: ABC transporter permease [Beijerinckiaceae bacterium]